MQPLSVEGSLVALGVQTEELRVTGTMCHQHTTKPTQHSCMSLGRKIWRTELTQRKGSYQGQLSNQTMAVNSFLLSFLPKMWQMCRETPILQGAPSSREAEPSGAFLLLKTCLVLLEMCWQILPGSQLVFKRVQVSVGSVSCLTTAELYIQDLKSHPLCG